MDNEATHINYSFSMNLSPNKLECFNINKRNKLDSLSLVGRPGLEQYL
jgi:hypothetical protein